MSDQFTYLVHYFSIFPLPTAPLFAIDRPQFTIFISPFIPDPDAVLFQVSNIGFPFQKPEQLMDNTFQVYLFGSDKRKSFLQIKPHLVAENTSRPRAGAIVLFDPVFENMLQEA